MERRKRRNGGRLRKCNPWNIQKKLCRPRFRVQWNINALKKILWFSIVSHCQTFLHTSRISLSQPLFHTIWQNMTLKAMFTETQRDIIANNQQYNNRFNYAVSFHFGQDSNSFRLEDIRCCHLFSCFRTTSSRLQSTPYLHSSLSTSSSSSNVQPISTFFASSFYRLIILPVFKIRSRH